MTRRGSRITVDLGDEELVKAVKIAAVEQGRTVRDIVVEALTRWLGEGHSTTPPSRSTGNPTNQAAPKSADPDYKSMIENLNRYRGVGQ